MGELTLISWCDSTLNLEMGCDGCELWNGLTRSCYAGVSTEKRAGNKGWPRSFGEPMIFPHRIEEALRWHDFTGLARPDKPWLDGLPRIVFLDDMGDTFTESLDLFWLRPFLEKMERSPHRWLVLTKRPKRAAEFFRETGVPRNVWVGTSVTDQATADARIPALARIPAMVTFLSCEPLLGPINLGRWLADAAAVDWVIVGGESGPDFRAMDAVWARAIRDQCDEAHVFFFYKQGAGRVSETDPTLDGREWRQMPEVS